MKKKLLFIFVSFFLLLIPFTAKAVTGKDGFLIKEYNVDIIVNENNSYDITETINVVFDDPSKHGIFRKIPYIKLVKINSSFLGIGTPSFFPASILFKSQTIFLARIRIFCIPSISFTTSSGVQP